MTAVLEPVIPRATRHAYRDRLVALMAADPRVVCLDTDTGLFSGVDFGAAADRYINLGIAEHNLMGIASGLARSGLLPYVNTMATFAANRAAEAVKLDIAYPGLPVRIMATHGGLAAGHLGPSHQSLEDIGFMRALPHMTVVVPADAAAVEAALDDSVALPGPLYLRLGRKATPPVTDARPEIGVAQTLRTGADVLIVAAGPHPVTAALDAADALARDGVYAAVLNLHTIKPLDGAALTRAAAGVALVVTVEEHWRVNGLGSAVAETLTEPPVDYSAWTATPARVLRIGVDDTFVTMVGDHDVLTEAYGISADSIVAKIRRALRSPSYNEGE